MTKVVVERLMFRSADGSLALAGYYVVAVGVVMIVGSVFNIVGRPERWIKRVPPWVPRPALVAWGVLGVIAGGLFVVLPFLAAPGMLY